VIWLFEGFRGGLPAAWGKTAHWSTVQGQDSVQTSSPGNNANDAEWLDTPFMSRVVPPDNFSVTATITIQQVVSNTTGDHSAGVEIFDANALNMIGAGVRCGLEHFDGQGPTLFAPPCSWWTTSTTVSRGRRRTAGTSTSSTGSA
jgi:hypothetical protein